MRIHTNDRPFTCHIPDCDMRFTRADTAAKHTRGHVRKLIQSGRKEEVEKWMEEDEELAYVVGEFSPDLEEVAPRQRVSGKRRRGSADSGEVSEGKEDEKEECEKDTNDESSEVKRPTKRRASVSVAKKGASRNTSVGGDEMEEEKSERDVTDETKRNAKKDFKEFATPSSRKNEATKTSKSNDGCKTTTMSLDSSSTVVTPNPSIAVSGILTAPSSAIYPSHTNASEIPTTTLPKQQHFLSTPLPSFMSMYATPTATPARINATSSTMNATATTPEMTGWSSIQYSPSLPHPQQQQHLNMLQHPLHASSSQPLNMGLMPLSLGGGIAVPLSSSGVGVGGATQHPPTIVNINGTLYAQHPISASSLGMGMLGLGVGMGGLNNLHPHAGAGAYQHMHPQQHLLSQLQLQHLHPHLQLQHSLHQIQPFGSISMNGSPASSAAATATTAATTTTAALAAANAQLQAQILSQQQKLRELEMLREEKEKLGRLERLERLERLDRLERREALDKEIESAAEKCGDVESFDGHGSTKMVHADDQLKDMEMLMMSSSRRGSMDLDLGIDLKLMDKINTTDHAEDTSTPLSDPASSPLLLHDFSSSHFGAHHPQQYNSKQFASNGGISEGLLALMNQNSSLEADDQVAHSHHHQGGGVFGSEFLDVVF
jgi:hypothetical protein